MKMVEHFETGAIRTDMEKEHKMHDYKVYRPYLLSGTILGLIGYVLSHFLITPNSQLVGQISEVAFSFVGLCSFGIICFSQVGVPMMQSCSRALDKIFGWFDKKIGC